MLFNVLTAVEVIPANRYRCLPIAGLDHGEGSDRLLLLDGALMNRFT
jgi:hypothetical protein